MNKPTNNSPDDSNTKIIRYFLKNPHKKIYFNAFFKICFQHTVGYLRYLKTRGFPIEIHDADEFKSLSDISYDVLGIFLKSKKDKPFFRIFDYYKRHNIDFSETDGTELYNHFTILLRGFIRRKYKKIFRDENPALVNLERRIKDILKESQYGTLKHKGDPTEYFYHEKYKNNLRRHRRPLMMEDVLTIVEKSFRYKQTKKAWVREIFEELDNTEEFQNYIKKYDLIRAAKSVYENHVELDGVGSSCIPPADETLLRNEVEKEKAKSLDYAKNIIMPLMAKMIKSRHIFLKSFPIAIRNGI
jgi:hypothetical protein